MTSRDGVRCDSNNNVNSKANIYDRKSFVRRAFQAFLRLQLVRRAYTHDGGKSSSSNSTNTNTNHPFNQTTEQQESKFMKVSFATTISNPLQTKRRKKDNRIVYVSL